MRPIELSSIANDYFSFMARTFPVMCLSDEFYFFPRAEEAILYLGSMESLDKDVLVEANRKVAQWMGEVDRLGQRADPSDATLLRGSMAGFLREFEKRNVRQEDPTLYLKIPLIGLDQLLSLEMHDHRVERDWVRDRVKSIPEILASGKRNLVQTPTSCKEAAQEMVRQCVKFLHISLAPWLSYRFGEDRELERGLEAAAGALEDFMEFLPSIPETPTFAVGEEVLALTLKESFGFSGTVAEVLEIARDEEVRAREALEHRALHIDPRKDWRTIYDGILIEGISPDTVLDYYRSEVMGLETFFRQADILPLPPGGSVVVEETPLYLQPIRATASYSAPFPGSGMARGRFFVNTARDSHQGSAERNLSVLHRESRLLSAHETYPGHHVLDWNRIHLAHPIRRQIESALFYEGWSCYAEQLTDESGYQPDRCQSLIRVKRELWRAVRARLDVELHVGVRTLESGAELLQGLGYSKQSASKQVRRYTLTPGYQLCYTLGEREFLRLKERFVSPLSLHEFHSVVLGEGEVPFHCLEHSLNAAASRRTIC